MRLGLRLFTVAIAAMLALVSSVASATFHTFRIEEIYSDASGTVQYVVLHESQGMDGQNLLAGHSFTSTQFGITKTFTFPNDLPGGSCSYYGGCSLSPTANKRVLIASQGFAALGLVTPDYVIPNGFLAINDGTINYAGVDQVTYTTLPTDGVHAIDRNGNLVQNVATNFAGNSASVPAPVANYQGLWWAAPAGSESGWGINFAHQGDIIFATWFTYDTTGKAWWLSMTATKTAPGVYAGTLYQTHGPAFNAMPFDPTKVTRMAVGSASLTFTDANDALFAYTVNGVAQSKTLTREVFGASVPVCTFGETSSLTLATNYQDLWWAAPAGSESGWGINLTEQSNTIFGTWFTYDVDGTPMWLSVTATGTAPVTYTGTLYRTTGPPFDAVPFDPARVTRTAVGTATFTFSDGANGTFAYTVNGVSQVKTITREVFVAPGTVCQ
ncbi:MAG: hypothetical protein KGJ99_13690 [Betaproteobacteria bacterium]|nr:hypothetical protein [Betaproteobacteria bacterium]